TWPMVRENLLWRPSTSDSRRSSRACADCSRSRALYARARSCRSSWPRSRAPSPTRSRIEPSSSTSIAGSGTTSSSPPSTAAPMRGSDGELLGILSVDEPISGRRPSGDEIDVLVAVSEHAALAVQSAQEAAGAKANRDALERLLQVSTLLNESGETPVLLERV